MLVHVKVAALVQGQAVEFDQEDLVTFVQLVVLPQIVVDFVVAD